MKLKVFFATVFVFLFAEEVYSLRLIYDGVKSTVCNYDGRYVRINLKECRENKNSQMECPATADSETRRHSSTNFTLEKPKKNKLSKLRCISFNNTYSLMVQGNNVSFVNVSCKDNVNKVVWFDEKLASDGLHHVFYYKQRKGFMCLTRGCTGTLNVTSVNSTDDRKCFFSTYNK